MLSIISSEPQELAAKIYEDIYGEVCISDTSWTNVGDAKVQYDDDASYKKHYVYKIKPQ